MLAQIPAAQRLTLVSHIGTGDDGDSLAGQNVQAFPDGALFYVTNIRRLYELVKNLPDTVLPIGSPNVVNGLGSSAVNGRFVAVQQAGEGVLVATGGGSVVTLDGWYTPGAQQNILAAVYVTPGGTQGFLHAARANDHSVTVTSSSATDTSTVLVFMVPVASA